MLEFVKNENFDSHYHNLKSEQDLIFQIFAYTLDECKLIKNYTDNEIRKMAHGMIMKGWLRGCINNGNSVWYRVTDLGKLQFKQIKRELENERKDDFGC